MRKGLPSIRFCRHLSKEKNVMSLTRLAPTCLALLLASSGAMAQQVYRCGSSYSQTPCGVDSVPVQTDDPRTDAQRTAAQQGLARDKALAKAMEATRHREEAQVFAGIKAEQAAMARKAADQKKSEEKKAREAKAAAKHKNSAGLRTVTVPEPGVFTVVAGTETPKKTKAQTAKAKSNAP
jgi:hypothetical protein